jgi:hypothetical protein
VLGNQYFGDRFSNLLLADVQVHFPIRVLNFNDFLQYQYPVWVLGKLVDSGVVGKSVESATMTTSAEALLLVELLD